MFWINGCEFLTDESNGEDCQLAPPGCMEVRPTEGQLIIRATINGKNSHVPIAVFRGDFEKGDLVLLDTLTTSGATYILPVDQDYSVVAEYIQADGDTVVAIDGDDVSVSKDGYCDKDCYDIDEGEIDVRLLFPKK
jgi:hypothetical protein